MSSHSRLLQYDLQGRLYRAVSDGKTREYRYDGNGNRIEFKENGHVLRATYDFQDRMTSYGKTDYLYTANGERSLKIEHSHERHEKCHHGEHGQRKTSYVFDGAGNLKTVTLPDRTFIEYLIDGQNRRVGKKVNGRLVQGFVYQTQTQIAAELDSAGKIKRQFVYGLKSNSPDYVIEAGRTFRIISDQVGTPRLIVDSETGKIVERLEFDEFGVPLKHKGSKRIPFGFAGGLYDEDTELVHFGARDYDPETGRWISKDPIGFAGGDTNLYGYVLNDPVNFIDPTGKSPLMLLIIALLTIGYDNLPPANQLELDHLLQQLKDDTQRSSPGGQCPANPPSPRTPYDTRPPSGPMRPKTPYIS